MLGTIARRTYSLFKDLRYGGILKGSVPSNHPEFFDTENSGYGVLGYLLNGRVRPWDTFVDVGCGKGRALNWWIDNYPKSRAYGIEINEDVGMKAKRRLRKYPHVTVLVGDALQLIPEHGSLFYMFNPFGEEQMRMFAEKIRARPLSAGGYPRRVVYYNSIFYKVFEGGGFTITPINLPYGHRCMVIDVTAS